MGRAIWADIERIGPQPPKKTIIGLSLHKNQGLARQFNEPMFEYRQFKMIGH
jgi:hypothetical protein